MAINSKQSKYSVFSSCILSFIHNRNTHNKSSHQIRKKGRKQRKNFFNSKIPSYFYLGWWNLARWIFWVNLQFTKEWNIPLERRLCSFLYISHFTLWLFWHFLLLSYHTLPTLHSYICIFMDIAHYSDGLLGKRNYKISRRENKSHTRFTFTYFVPIKSLLVIFSIEE